MAQDRVGGGERSASQEQAADPLLGTSIGGYRIVQLIGCGGMGVVYRVEHQVMGARAALKVLRPHLMARAELVARFVDEARAAARIRHPNVVQIYDFVPLADGRPAILMELVEGQSIEERLRDGPMAWDRAIGILAQVSDALAAAHAQSVVHRDIKTDNVLLVPGAGGADVVKVFDFGIAQLRPRAEGLTGPGTVMGTPLYMSPEQVMGRDVDARSDVYSVGVLGYRLLVGEYPYEGGSPTAIMLKHVQAPVPEAPGLPPGLSGLLRRALAKNPAERFADCAAMAIAFRQEVRGQGASAGRPPGAARAIAGSAAREAPGLQPAREPWFREVEATPAEGSRHAESGPPFIAELEGEVLSVRFESVEAFARVEEAELSKGRLYVPFELPVTMSRALTLRLRVPGREDLERAATVVMLAGRQQARDWGLAPGFALEIARRPAHGLPKPAADQGATAMLIELFERRLEAADPYLFLGVSPEASSGEIASAIRRVTEEFEAVGESTDHRLGARLARLRLALERAAQLLSAPETRAIRDAGRGNFRGVARALDAGLAPERLEQLHRSYAQRFPDRIERSERLARAAEESLSRGERRRGLELLERSLALDPLDGARQQRLRDLGNERRWAVRPQEAEVGLGTGSAEFG